MDEDKKEELEEEKDEEKLTRKEKKEKDIEELEERIKGVEAQLEENGIDLDDNRFRTIYFNVRHRFLYTLVEVVIGFGLLLGLTGIIGWLSHSGFLVIILTLFGISLVDNMCGYLIKTFLFRVYLKSFTTIRLVPTILLFILLYFFGKYINLTVISIGGMIGTIVLYVVLKAIIMLIIKSTFQKRILK